MKTFSKMFATAALCGAAMVGSAPTWATGTQDTAVLTSTTSTGPSFLDKMPGSLVPMGTGRYAAHMELSGFLVPPTVDGTAVVTRDSNHIVVDMSNPVHPTTLTLTPDPSTPTSLHFDTAHHHYVGKLVQADATHATVKLDGQPALVTLSRDAAGRLSLAGLPSTPAAAVNSILLTPSR